MGRPKLQERVCKVCKEKLPREKFRLDSRGYAKGRMCRACEVKDKYKRYWAGDREKILAYRKSLRTPRIKKPSTKERYHLDPEYRTQCIAQAKAFHESKTPWGRTLYTIRGRCGKRKHYAHIKNFLTIKDLEFLWFRDLADFIDKPSIDRIDPDGDYTLENCRYISMSENSKRARRKTKSAVTS